MISSALSETFLCRRLFGRVFKPSVLIVFEGGAVYHCEVVSVVDLTVEGGGDSSPISEGEW